MPSLACIDFLVSTASSRRLTECQFGQFPPSATSIPARAEFPGSESESVPHVASRRSRIVGTTPTPRARHFESATHSRLQNLHHKAHSTLADCEGTERREGQGAPWDCASSLQHEQTWHNASNALVEDARSPGTMSSLCSFIFRSNSHSRVQWELPSHLGPFARWGKSNEPNLPGRARPTREAHYFRARRRRQGSRLSDLQAPDYARG